MGGPKNTKNWLDKKVRTALHKQTQKGICPAQKIGELRPTIFFVPLGMSEGTEKERARISVSFFVLVFHVVFRNQLMKPVNSCMTLLLY
jgi:hypothetical protein